MDLHNNYCNIVEFGYSLLLTQGTIGLSVVTKVGTPGLHVFIGVIISLLIIQPRPISRPADIETTDVLDLNVTQARPEGSIKVVLSVVVCSAARGRERENAVFLMHCLYSSLR